MKKLIAVILVILSLFGAALADQYMVTDNVNLRDVKTRNVITVVRTGSVVESYKDTGSNLWIRYDKGKNHNARSYYGTIYKQYARLISGGNGGSAPANNQVTWKTFDMLAPYDFFFYQSPSFDAASVYLAKGTSVHVMAWTNEWIYATIYGVNGYIHF